MLSLSLGPSWTTSAGCSSFDLHYHHHLQQQRQFLSSGEPFTVLTGSHWCGAAFPALSSTGCYSLATYCTHKQYGDCIAKCTQCTSVLFSSAQAAHNHWSVCSCRHRSPLCFSPPPSLYLSFKKGGRALAAVLQAHSVFFCSGGNAEVERQRGLMILCVWRACVSLCVCVCLKLHAAALSLQTSRLCHSCSGGRGVYSCRRR